MIHHDEDAEVYLNGVLATRVRRLHEPTTRNSPSPPQPHATLKPGKNTIAIHCKQTGGGQYIDVGLVEIVPAGKSKGR